MKKLIIIFYLFFNYQTFGTIQKPFRHYTIEAPENESELITENILKLKKLYSNNSQSESDFIKLIYYCESQCKANNIPLKYVLGTIARESSFNHLAENKNSSARGLSQFLKVCSDYHKVDYDSLFNPYYSIDVIIIRFNDILKRFKGKSDAFYIVAYGSYLKAENTPENELLQTDSYLKYLSHLEKIQSVL